MASNLLVTRDWQGQAVIVAVINGLHYVVHHSRDFDRDSWVRLVEEVSASGADTRAREAARLSPAQRADQSRVLTTRHMGIPR